MTRRLSALLFAAPIVLVVLAACQDLLAPSGKATVDEVSRLQLSGRVVVHPGDMDDWVFINDQNGSVCTGSTCQFVVGPTGQPRGSGSAELAVTSVSEGYALVLPGYLGVRFDRISSLRFSTYRQTVDAGNNLAIALQFNVDYDLGDASSAYQGRIVFEPYVGAGGTVAYQTWQEWDAKAGKWWGTRATVTVNSSPVSNSCVQSAPCSWSQLLTAFPDIGIHAIYGAIVLKAGSGWADFRGNVDNLTIGVDSVDTTYDFELNAPPAVPANAPISVPWALLHPSRIVIADSLDAPVFADLIELEFHSGTSLAERETAIASVGGIVVGGFDTGDAEDSYLIQLPADPTGATMRDALTSLAARTSTRSVFPELAFTDALSYRRPNEGGLLTKSAWILNPDSAFAGPDAPWAASAVAAPHAWGCASGAGVLLAVIDMGLAFNPEFSGRLSAASELRPAELTPALTHGQSVATVAAATMDNGIGVAGIAPESNLLLLDVSGIDSSTMRMGTESGKPVAYLGAIREAIRKIREERANVVNVSIGGGVAPTAIQDSTYRSLMGRLKADIDTASGWDPLFVVAAGNAGAGGRHDWGIFGSLRDSVADRVLIVGGAEKQLNTAWNATSTGGIVDIYAPAVIVAGFDSLNNFASPNEGTSFAAPLVAGAASLLLSFDSRLTAVQVRSMLLNGATPSRSVSSKPFLDVYGALRLASAEPGAPLCGNRIWADAANGFFVQRGVGSELLFTVGTDPFDATYANVHHGGRRIELAHGLRYVLNGTTWGTGSWANDDTAEFSGAFKGSGALYQDHDDRFRSSMAGMRSASSVTFDVLVESLDSLTPNRAFQATASAPALVSSLTSSCIREEFNGATGAYECAASGDEGIIDRPSQWSPDGSGGFTSSNVLHALDPQGRFVVVLLGVRRHSSTISATWEPCFGSVAQYPAIRCRGYSANDEVSLRTELYRIDLVSGAALRLSVPALAEGPAGDEVFWLSIDERGEEIAVQVGGFSLGSSGFGCTNGRHLWLRFGSSTGAALTSGHVVSIPGLSVCDGALDGSGGSAASRFVP